MNAAQAKRSLALGMLFAAALGGCANPDATTQTSGTAIHTSVQNAGEPVAPSPARPAAQAPVDVRRTAAEAACAFAERYINWSYRTLARQQRQLAAMAVGAARLAEQQAAASTQRDLTIARGHVDNSGQIVTVAPDDLQAGWWTIVTRERTGGNPQYEGLPAAYHLTLAQLVTVPGGYAVEQWLPQN